MHEFSIGDGVVCPPHGAGTVVDINEREEGGEQYLSIRIEHQSMTLMVPVSAVADRGIRSVIDEDSVEEVLHALTEEGEALPANHQHRARFVTERARTSDALELAALIRDLAGHSTERKLSAGESRALETAKQRLASELCHARSIDTDEARALIDNAVGCE